MVSSVQQAELLSKYAQETLRQVQGSLGEQSAVGAVARGKVFELVGYFEDAIASYSQAMALEHTNDEAAARLALSEIKARRPQQALASATALATRAPKFTLKALATDEHISAMTILGDALLLNDRLEDAVQAYNTARQINSTDSYAAGRLAQVFLALGDSAKAMQMSTAINGNPRFAGVASLLSLGQSSAGLLRIVNRASVVAAVAGSAAGRPFVVDATVRTSRPVLGCEEWCAEIR